MVEFFLCYIETKTISPTQSSELYLIKELGYQKSINFLIYQKNCISELKMHM